jgi:hypothetical protein
VIVPEIVKPCRAVAVKFAVAGPFVMLSVWDAGVNKNPALLGVTVYVPTVRPEKV